MKGYLYFFLSFKSLYSIQELSPDVEFMGSNQKVTYSLKMSTDIIVKPSNGRTMVSTALMHVVF